VLGRWDQEESKKEELNHSGVAIPSSGEASGQLMDAADKGVHLRPGYRYQFLPWFMRMSMENELHHVLLDRPVVFGMGSPLTATVALLVTLDTQRR